MAATFIFLCMTVGRCPVFLCLFAFQFVSNNAIPSFITSNAFIARKYAKLILSYIRDQVNAGGIDPSHPVYVLEAGSGSGRFAYMLLKCMVEGLHLAGIPLSCLK